jgi:hypothetical protein
MSAEASGPQKHGRAVFADDGAKGYKTDLRTPMNGDKSLGGYMGLKLHAITIDGVAYMIKDYNAFVSKQVGKDPGDMILVFDTGAMSYFTNDDTGVVVVNENKEPLQSLGLFEYLHDEVGLANHGLGLDVKMYGLHFREDDGRCFDVQIPVQWRAKFFGKSAILERPHRSNSTRRSNMLVVGNMFMQSIAISYSCSPTNLSVTLDYLDSNGARVQHSLVPEDTIPHGEIGQKLPAFARPGWTKEGFLSPALDPNAIVVGSATAGAPTPPTNVSVDMIFMAPTSLNMGIISRETRDPNTLSLPSIKFKAGDVDMIFVVDTGSGITIAVQDVGEDVGRVRNDSGPCSGCENPSGCMISDILGSYKSGPCKSVADAQCNPCCKICCLPEGVQSTDKRRCAVKYCTGAISYDPTFRTFDFGNDHLRKVDHFVGKATPLCLPSPDTNIFGAWRWSNPLEGTRISGTLPYWILKEIGQFGGDFDNMTLMFWRSDLLEAPVLTPCGGHVNLYGVGNRFELSFTAFACVVATVLLLYMRHTFGRAVPPI